MVHAIDEHGGVVFGGGALDDFLGTGVDVFLAGFLGQEQAGGFDDDVSTDFVPLQVGGIALLGQADGLAIDDDVTAFDLDIALEAAVHAVVLQHVGEVVGLEQVVDRHHFDVGEVLDGAAQHVAANAAEAVDTDFDGHVR